MCIRDRVIVDDDGAIFPGPVSQHLLPLVVLAEVVGRGADIDNYFRSGQGLDFGRALVKPDILTNIKAKGDSVKGVDGALGACLEIAALIKDAVIGQQHLMVYIQQFAVPDKGDGVVYVLALAVNKPDG